MFDYTTLSEDALEVLKEYGLPVTVFKPHPGTTFDPIGGVNISGGADIALQGYGIKQDIKEGVFHPDLVLQASEMVFMSAFGINQRPCAGDAGTIGDEAFVVVDIKTTSPGGVDISYLLLVRT